MAESNSNAEFDVSSCSDNVDNFSNLITSIVFYVQFALQDRYFSPMVPSGHLFWIVFMMCVSELIAVLLVLSQLTLMEGLLIVKLCTCILQRVKSQEQSHREFFADYSDFQSLLCQVSITVCAGAIDHFGYSHVIHTCLSLGSQLLATHSRCWCAV